ncbi:hypothetical protein [uncultured Robinsoniella sp.]|uniref:hypothetical protein n=1 Tax=uncultured Robinsoniella sp. TaxID=904190 RepID=UPI00374EAD98
MKYQKMIAPIVITVLLVIFLLLYLTLIAYVPFPVIIKILFGIIIMALIGVSFFVLAERLKEIRSGEEDDLSKY